MAELKTNEKPQITLVKIIIYAILILWTIASLYPPVAGLPSLSRLMKDGIGPGMTRDDHKDVSSQLFAAYSKVKQVRNLASIIGEEELSEADKRYLKFGEKFEQIFLTQDEFENRDIGRTLDLGWEVLTEIPRDELLRIKQELIEKYLEPILARQKAEVV